jgi:hypothetical protein
MHSGKLVHFGRAVVITVVLGAFLATTMAAISAAQDTSPPVALDEDDLGGVVSSTNGREAGVWVIAETTDLPTRYTKIVVTDDQGRYLLPDLPRANYLVWARGYGLVDSPKVVASPGRNLDLTAVVAPDARAAAQYYPAGYWASLLQPPSKDEFPGTGEDGNGIPTGITTQAQWLRLIKGDSCWSCHNIGNRAIREFPEGLGTFASSLDAWTRRVQSGQAGSNMVNTLGQLGQQRALSMFADWTDRIAAGEVPPAPPRPQGIERNIVITQWDWVDPKHYLHDLVSTDRRNPTVNANGPQYGSLELSADYTPVLDPIAHTTNRIPLTPRDEATPPSVQQSMLQPSPYWGDEIIWTSRTNVHNPMLDGEGRLWLTATIRPPANPDFCREGSEHPSAKAFPNNQAGRHLAMYDPRTQQLTHIDTCFSTHHLMFAEDANNTLWTSGGGQVVGWLNTKMFIETGDAVASQGWTPLILDTNGNGQRDAWVEPDQDVDPTMDKRIVSGFYGVAPAPDGSVWGSTQGYPGQVIRITPGSNPSETALAEIFEMPVDASGEPVVGFSPRGMDVDRNGVVWMGASSGHMASFDRRKCTGPLNGPTATGQHCPEGWSFYAEPLPQVKGVDYAGSAGVSYYTWVDQFNTSGLGANTPINTGNAAEGLLALVNEQWVVLRVPYPMGFFVKWMDGRIDDPNAGWKGRALWTTTGNRTPFHMETGKGTLPKAMKFQVRPDPLAK